MSKVGMSLLLAILTTTACEQRKGGLLPARKPSATATEHETAKNKSALSAKTLPESMRDQFKDEDTNDSIGHDEGKETESVKQEALERIKKFPTENLADGTSPRGKAADLYKRGQQLATTGKIQEAQEYYLLACQFGYIQGCHRFGWQEERAGNAANARQFYKLACEGGLSKSCNNLGIQFESLRNWDEALDFYARACLGKHSVSCDNLKRLRLQRLQIR